MPVASSIPGALMLHVPDAPGHVTDATHIRKASHIRKDLVCPGARDARVTGLRRRQPRDGHVTGTRCFPSKQTGSDQVAIR